MPFFCEDNATLVNDTFALEDLMEESEPRTRSLCSPLRQMGAFS